MTDENGALGKPVPSGQVTVPGRLELDNDCIRWELWGPARCVEISRTTLNEFVKLWSEDSSAALRFAKKWGVLLLEPVKGGYRPCGDGIPEGYEPIAAWQYYSRRACAVLNVAAALGQGKLGDLDDLKMITVVRPDDLESMKVGLESARKYGLPIFTGLPEKTKRQSAVDRGHDVIAQEIENWLCLWKARRMNGLSDFRLQWHPKAKRWELQIDYHGFLFAAIALQLMLAVAGADSLFTCSGCGLPYIRETKRPKAGNANYCGGCSRKGVPQRRAVEAYRRKQAEAFRLYGNGVPVMAIATSMHSPVAMVRKWLRKEESKSQERASVRKVRPAVPQPAATV